MKAPEDCRDMSDIREAIDSIDNSIVELIAKRSEYVYQAAKFKTSEKAVRDEERVKSVIRSKRELAEKYGASPELIERIYTLMIDFFISEEMKEWKTQQ